MGGSKTPLGPNGVISSSPSAPLEAVPFPFGVEFQIKLQKVLMSDDAGELVMGEIKASFFESPELRWIFHEMSQYHSKYSAMPTYAVLKHVCQTSADAKMRPTIYQLLEYQEGLVVKEEAYIREELLNWIRQNNFHTLHRETTLLWNSGKREEAMSHNLKGVERINEILWREVDRGYFFEELPTREFRREQAGVTSVAIPTGIGDLDKMLNGGISPGELGIWIAYAKGGKSSLLLNHGAQACRSSHRKVLHFVLEGSRKLIEDRYDTWFADEIYSQVKHGGMSESKYKVLWQEYQYLQHLLIIRGLTTEWNYTAQHLDAELKDLKKTLGWTPDMIVVDYADLVRGREGPYAAEWQSQMASIRDIKSIANRGYAVWTASQAQRPAIKDYDVKEHKIHTAQIAGGIEKVRAADFIGSINSTIVERKAGTARLFAELYRDNEAGLDISIYMDLAKMKMGGTPPAVNGVGNGPIPLGYDPGKKKK